MTTPWFFSQDLGYSLFTLAILVFYRFSWRKCFLISLLFRNLVNSWLFSLAHLGIYKNEEWSHCSAPVQFDSVTSSCLSYRTLTSNPSGGEGVLPSHISFPLVNFSILNNHVALPITMNFSKCRKGAVRMAWRYAHSPPSYLEVRTLTSKLPGGTHTHLQAT